jgi:hypothetical protein
VLAQGDDRILLGESIVEHGAFRPVSRSTTEVRFFYSTTVF